MYATILILALTLGDRWLKKLVLDLPASSLTTEAVFFKFTLFKNAGLFFSLPFPWQKLVIIFSFLLIAVLIRALFRSWREKNLINILAWLLIIAGATSNLADRLFYGFVIDYWCFFGTSCLNLADLMIFSGILILISRHHLAKMPGKT